MKNTHVKALLIFIATLTACADEAESGRQKTDSIQYKSHFIDAEISRNLGDGRDLVTSENFRRATYDRGISIDVPTDWYILDQRTTEYVGKQGGVAFDALNMERAEGHPTYLIKANSTQTKAAAIMSLTTSQPPSASASEVRKFTPRDFQEMDNEFRNMYEKMMRLQGGALITWHGVHLEYFGNHPAIVTEYERQNLTGPGTFIVQTNQIFTPTREVRLTMSYNTSVGMVYMPVLTRVRKSLTIDE